MKRFAIPAISLAALMASGIALAQTTPDQQPSTQPSQEMQQKQDPAAPAPSTTDPSKSSEQPKVEQPKADTTAQQPAPSDSNVAVTVDASKAVLATSFIGSAVYTSTDENIGDINDLIFDDKGTIQAVIIGVGGFLGMGEKDVALPLDKINLTKDENNAVKLTVQASREDLEKAPAFDKTLFLVKTPAGDSTTTQPTTPGGGSTTTPQQ